MAVGEMWASERAQGKQGEIYFQIVRRDGGYGVEVRTAEHELLFLSYPYTSKAAARSAIDLLRRGATAAPVRD